MNNYLIGSDIIGADVPAPAAPPPVRLTDEQAKTVILSARVGALLGLVGGALLWRKHPVGGALLGGLLIGPSVGATYGFATMKKNA